MQGITQTSGVSATYLFFIPTDFHLTLAGIANFIQFALALFPGAAGTEANLFSYFLYTPVTGQGVFISSFLNHSFTS
jgi:hypothetical protein